MAEKVTQPIANAEQPVGAAMPLPAVQIRLVDPRTRQARTIALPPEGLTVGRLPENGLVLDAPLVSRTHLRIDWDGQRVLVTDLGSRSGSQLGSTRLAPQAPEPWQADDYLQVGPYTLRLVGGAAAPRRPATGAYPALELPPARASVALGPGQDLLNLYPGQSVAVTATVRNLGPAADSFALAVEGLPAEWVKLPAALPIEAGAQAAAAITIAVPAEPSSRAAAYPVTVRASAQSNPADSAATFARWDVQPFSASRLELSPKRARTREQAVFSALVSNQGNAPARYTLGFDDDEHVLSGTFGQPQIAVEPGQAAEVPLTVLAPRKLVGASQRYSFSVRAGAAGQPSQIAQGQLVCESLLPIWLLPALASLVMLLLLCGFGAIPASFASGLPLYRAFLPLATPTGEAQATALAALAATNRASFDSNATTIAILQSTGTAAANAEPPTKTAAAIALAEAQTARTILEQTQAAQLTSAAAPTATPSPSDTPTPSPTPTRTVAPTSTRAAVGVITSTPTRTVTLPPTPTITETPTETEEVTVTTTRTSTTTPTRTSTTTPTRTSTTTPTRTSTTTPTRTSTTTPTRTSTTTPTRTSTTTPTRTSTITPEPPTNTPTDTPTATLAPPAITLQFDKGEIQKYDSATFDYSQLVKLTINITNNNQAVLSQIRFYLVLNQIQTGDDDALRIISDDQVLSPYMPPAVFNGCGGNLQADPTNSIVELTQAELIAGASCSITIIVRTSGSAVPNPPDEHYEYIGTAIAAESGTAERTATVSIRIIP